MGWVIYQSWQWFFNYKSPAFSAVSSAAYTTPDVAPLVNETVQQTVTPQVSVPPRYVQPDVEQATFTKQVCSAAELDAINKEIAEIEAMLQAKPNFAYDTEYGTRLAELQNACK